MRRVHLARSYRNAVMALGPVGYWRLGEASGTVAKDETGRNHGTYVNAPTLGVAGAIAGDANTAMTLNGTTQYITAGTGAQVSGSLTLACWIKHNGAPAGDKRIISRRDWASGDGYELYLSPTGKPTVYLATGASLNTRAGLVAVIDNAWHFVVAACDAAANTVTFSVDGVPEPAWATTVDVTSNAAVGLVIGATIHPVGLLAGSLDEPVVFDRALPPADIARLDQIGRGF